MKPKIPPDGREMSSTIKDETLMAYADGELDAAESMKVERALACDAQLRRRLQAFRSTGREVLARAFDQPMHEPVPPELLRPLASPQQHHRRTGHGWRLGKWLPAREEGVSSGWPELRAGSLATAAATLLLGATLGVWFGMSALDNDEHQIVRYDSGIGVALSGLHAALERLPSRETASWTAGAGDSYTLQPLMTFQDERERYCREYRLTGRNGSMLGVACRAKDGRWRVQLQVADAASAQAGTTFQPAAPERQLIDTFVHEHMVGEPLDHTAEARIIKDAWAGAGTN